MQHIIIKGNLGADPKEHTGQNGIFHSISVAVTRKNRDGEKTTWYKAIVQEFQKNMVPYLKKGDSVIVVGELDADIYEGGNGAKLDLEIKNARVDFGGSKSPDNSVAPNTNQPGTASQTRQNAPKTAAAAYGAEDSDLPF